jgi:regulator of protease activity HflC (stomatin/prohibitin superfamily)
VERAEEERARLIEENSVVRAAHERSQALIMDAETRARQMLAEADSTVAAHLSEAAEAASKQLDDADQYALEVLRRLENQLQAFLEARSTMSSTPPGGVMTGRMLHEKGTLHGSFPSGR